MYIINQHCFVYFSVFEIIYESSQAKPQLGQTIVKGDEFGVSSVPNLVPRLLLLHSYEVHTRSQSVYITFNFVLHVNIFPKKAWE